MDLTPEDWAQLQARLDALQWGAPLVFPPILPVPRRPEEHVWTLADEVIFNLDYRRFLETEGLDHA